MAKKIICCYGSFDKDYVRNHSLIEGLKQHYDVTFINSKKNFVFRSIEFIAKTIIRKFDLLFVLYPAHLDVFTAKLLAGMTNTPIILDKFVSLADSEIEYGNVKNNSLKAKRLKQLDKRNCLAADKVLLDTPEHIDFFVKEFSLPESLFDFVHVGTNEELFFPEKKLKENNKLRIFFFGIVTPFQGFETICKAAELLEKNTEIEFELLGYSKHFLREKEKYSHLQNVKFSDKVSLQELAKKTRESDIYLGVFGNTPKLDRVIPTKIVKAIACGKPLITARSKAVERVFTDKQDILFIDRANPKALAEAILYLKFNPKEKEKISANARKLFERQFSYKAIGLKLKEVINKELNE
ncbi:MAG: glycosyltransferase [archaeon]